MMLQPTPPVPPGFDPIFMNGMQDIIIAVVGAIVVTVVAIKVLAPMARAMARRLEGKITPELKIEMDQMRDQLAEMDELRGRVLELEERVEFAERMLIQSGDPNLMPKREH